MTISYNWLCDYFPDNLLQKPGPELVSRILTSVGLEVETLLPYSSVRGSLEGLVVGEVISVEPHPNADKLKITRVNIGSGENLQIVCGAENVAPNQKVVVALVGSTLHPESGEPIQIKAAEKVTQVSWCYLRPFVLVWHSLNISNPTRILFTKSVLHPTVWML